MSERFKIIDDNLWDLEKSEMLLTGEKLGFFKIPYFHGYSVCDILNELSGLNNKLAIDKSVLQERLFDSLTKNNDCLLKARNELYKLFNENKTLKHMNDCLQKQLDCTNKNYNELSKRYYNLQQSNKLRQDELLPDSSLEKRLVDCEEYLKKMQSGRDIYKNKYEKLSKKSKELFLHLKNTVVWYLGKAFANTNINEIYYNKILNCLDDIETKLIGVVNNEKV